MVKKSENIVDEYLNYYSKYKKMFGKKVLILMQVGSFHEAYCIENKGPNLHFIGNEINLTTQPNGSTEFIAIIGAESVADGAGFEILAHNGGAARHKTIHYVHNATYPSMEVKSEGAALDLRINNTTDDSYYSVYDNSTHKQLLTSDALFINTSDGSITNGSDTAALYLSRNGPKSSSNNSDENGDWRIRVNGTGTGQELSFEQYDGSNWNMQWQLV